MSVKCGLDEKYILDIAAKIGVQAKLERIAKAWLENIIASLELTEDEKNSLLVTAAFAHRQAARLRGGRTARLISEAMRKLYSANCGKREARKLLGLSKWVFEATENVRLPPIDIRELTFEKLLEALSQAR